VWVLGGTLYYHHQLLLVIEADDAEQAAKALGTKIVGSFDRSRANLPTVYYTGISHENQDRASNHKEGCFFLSLKELEPGDESTHPDLVEKTHLKVTAPRAVRVVA
jgi:hypothetical protein